MDSELGSEGACVCVCVCVCVHRPCVHTFSICEDVHVCMNEHSSGLHSDHHILSWEITRGSQPGEADIQLWVVSERNRPQESQSYKSHGSKKVTLDPSCPKSTSFPKKQDKEKGGHSMQVPSEMRDVRGCSFTSWPWGLFPEYSPCLHV